MEPTYPAAIEPPWRSPRWPPPRRPGRRRRPLGAARGEDRLDGGAGGDTPRSRAGNEIFGGAGDDELQALTGTGEDLFDCGPGRGVLVYTADVDQQYRIVDCERVIPNGGEGG